MNQDEYFSIPINVWAALAISLISTIALLFLPSLLSSDETQVKVVQMGVPESQHALETQNDLLDKLKKEAKEIREKCEDSSAVE